MRYVNVNTKPLFDYISIYGGRNTAHNLNFQPSRFNNYMYGKKSWFKTLLRDYICHLLDIDGDKCHNMLNITRKFLLPFQKQIEYFCNDLHNDST